VGRVESWGARVWSLTAEMESEGCTGAGPSFLGGPSPCALVARPGLLSRYARGLLPGSPSPAARSPPPATRERPRSTHLCLDCPSHRKPSPPQSIKVRRCVESPHRRAYRERADLDCRAADWFAVSFPSSQEGNHRTKPSHPCTSSLYEFASLAYPKHTWSEDGQRLLTRGPGPSTPLVWTR
jgi:hypothetical protein